MGPTTVANVTEFVAAFETFVAHSSALLRGILGGDDRAVAYWRTPDTIRRRISCPGVLLMRAQAQSAILSSIVIFIS
jgi:hypothetical protein